MSTYRTRAPRTEVSFPVRFIAEGRRWSGTCHNLSESGLLATFAVQLEIWIPGEVDLYVGTDLLGLKVRVARVVGLEAGLSFQHGDGRQRQEIRDFIISARKDGFLPEPYQA